MAPGNSAHTDALQAKEYGKKSPMCNTKEPMWCTYHLLPSLGASRSLLLCKESNISVSRSVIEPVAAPRSSLRALAIQ